MEKNFKKEIYNTIKKYNLINNGDKIVVGVSGGPDSICLINVLDEIRRTEEYRLKFDLYVAHINHNIREEAKSDEEFVVNYCKSKGIEVYVLSTDIYEKSKKEKIGTEEAGRKARYEFFEKILNDKGANKIATAHTSNDNAETVLMNIMRGTSTSGLKGIRPIRDNKFIRPLIESERNKIEKYCDEYNLNPRIDKTNFENEYTRNKVRNLLIPFIKEKFNPNIIETINRMSNIANDENEYLENETEKHYKQMLVDEKLGKQIILDLKKFNNQHFVIKKRIILYTINKVQGNTQGLGKIHIEDIIKLCKNNIGNKYLTPNKNLKILIKNKKIFFVSYL
jgi:tRNA(Ile)-lysidine synthase